jgi:hypothetical protein
VNAGANFPRLRQVPDEVAQMRSFLILSAAAAFGAGARLGKYLRSESATPAPTPERPIRGHEKPAQTLQASDPLGNY